jgi:hypothetical protein
LRLELGQHAGATVEKRPLQAVPGRPFHIDPQVGCELEDVVHGALVTAAGRPAALADTNPRRLLDAIRSRA